MSDQKTYFFMAGLPRSGSTLLSAILNQNPRIYSGPNSPVLGIMSGIEEYLTIDESFNAFPKQQQAGEMIANSIVHYYSDIKKPVIIDKNRAWPAKLEYITGYFGIEPKIICPVRNLSEIIASFIAMHRRNPFEIDGKLNFIDQMLVKNNLPLNDYNRCQVLSGEGVIGNAYDDIKSALIKGKQKYFHFVEYDDLINDPETTMKNLYEFLEEDNYKHDFENIVNINQEKDAEVFGFADMHSVRKEISKTSIDPTELLPEDVLKACEGSEFWKNLDDINSKDNQSTKEIENAR
jgi:sulfotransferase